MQTENIARLTKRLKQEVVSTKAALVSTNDPGLNFYVTLIKQEQKK